MNNQIDDALARLATSIAHPGLAGLEDRVLHAIAPGPVRSLGVGTAVATAALALCVGVLSNVVPSADARAATVLSPFGAVNPLAPATLLATPR